MPSKCSHLGLPIVEPTYTTHSNANSLGKSNFPPYLFPGLIIIVIIRHAHDLLVLGLVVIHYVKTHRRPMSVHLETVDGRSCDLIRLSTSQ